MEITLTCTDKNRSFAWHITPTHCDFHLGLDGSLTIKPADSHWAQIDWKPDFDR
jgi:hypothetical protein